jgi:hypothetical protein
MFTAYFDESGTHKDSSVVVVAGYLSTDEQWTKFSSEWLAILDRYKIDCFHMTDFENRRKQFKILSEADRQRLLDRLIAFIKIRQRIGIGVTFGMADYNEIVQEFSDLPIKKPYAFCAIQCMVLIKNWLVKHKLKNNINYIYEEGAQHAGQILSAYEGWMKQAEFGAALRLGSLAFGSKRDRLPLQAADILAYETWKEVSNTLAGRPRKTRWPMAKLAEAPLSGLHIQKEIMRNLINLLRNKD